MSQHIVSAFDEDLAAISADVARLGLLAGGEIADAITALVRRDSELAQAVVERDRSLDQLELDIEDRAVRLIALRQPVAQDLRRPVAAMKMAANLERCGDLAKNIAKRAIVVSETESVAALMRPTARLGALVQRLLASALQAYAESNLVLAREVWSGDREIDEEYESLVRELLTYMMSDPRTISAGAHLLFVAKNLERIGDHATNIAEITHYEITGEQLTARPKLDSVRP